MHSVGLPESLHQARPHELGATSITDFLPPPNLDERSCIRWVPPRSTIIHGQNFPFPFPLLPPSTVTVLLLPSTNVQTAKRSRRTASKPTKRDASPSSSMVVAEKRCQRSFINGQYHNLTSPPPRHALPRHSGLHSTSTTTPQRHPPSPQLRHPTSKLLTPPNPAPPLHPLDTHHRHHLHTRPHPTLLRTLHRPPHTWRHPRRRALLS